MAGLNFSGRLDEGNFTGPTTQLLSVAPLSTLGAKQAVTLTFDAAYDPDSLSPPLENGSPKVGTWVFNTLTAIFTPTEDWETGHSIVVDYSMVTTVDGTTITNPGTVTLMSDKALVSDLAFAGISPAQGSFLVGSAPITVTFSEPVDATTMQLPVLDDGTLVAGAWVSVGNTAVFTPAAPWPTTSNVMVEYANVQTAGNEILTNPGFVSFSGSTVASGFAFVSYTTANGDTLFDASEAITLTFNEPVQASTLPVFKDADGKSVLGSWVTSGNNAIFTPLVPWASYNAPVTLDTSAIVSADGDTNTNGIEINSLVTSPPVFVYSGFTTGDADGNLRDKETLTLNFSSPVNTATLPVPTNGSGLPVAGTWSIAGTTATFTPVSNWQDLVAPVSMNLSGVAGTNGVLATGSLLLSLVMEPAPTFSYVIYATGDADGNVRHLETVTLTFSEPVVASGLALPSFGGSPVAGSWVAVGSTAVFTPVVSWQSVGAGPFIVALTPALVAASGATLDFAQNVSLPMETPVPFNYLGFATGDADSDLRDLETLTLSFDSAVDVSTLPNPVDATSTAIPGTWVASGNDVIFTPTTNWQNLTGPLTVALSTAVSTAGEVIPVAITVTVPVEVSPFTYVGVFAAEGDGNVRGLEAVTFTFNLPVNAATLPTSFLTSDTVPNSGTGSWSAVGNSATFTPLFTWESRGVGPYKFNIASVTDTSANALSNPQIVPIAEELPLAFTYLSMTTGEGDGDLYDNESVILTFTTPPDIATMNTGAGVPAYYNSAFNVRWLINGLGTWTAGPGPNDATYTLTHATTNTWQVIPNIDLTTPLRVYIHSSFKSLDGASVTNAQYIGVPFESGPTFTYTSFVTAGADNNVRNLEAVTFTFDAPVDSTTLPTSFATSDATPVAGLGTWVTAGNTATFTPSINYQVSGSGPYKFDFTAVKNTLGTTITNPLFVPVAQEPNIADTFAITAAGLANNTRVTVNSVFDFYYSTRFAGTVFAPNIAGLALPKYADNSNVAGTWSLAHGSLRIRFTPSAALPAMKTITFDLTGFRDYDNAALVGPVPYVYNTNWLTVTGGTDTGNNGKLTNFDQLIISFNTAVDATTMPVVYQQTSLTPNTANPIAGTWSAIGMNALFTPSVAWNTASFVVARVDMTPLAPVGINGANFLSPEYVAVAIAPVTFSVSGHFSQENDGNLYDFETVTITSSEPPNLSTLPVPMFGTTPVSGSWSTTGNQTKFTPSVTWQSVGAGPFKVEWPSTMVSTTGSTLSNPSFFNYPLEAAPVPMTITLFNPVTNSTITNVQDLFFTFSEPVTTASINTVRLELVGSPGSFVTGAWTDYGSNRWRFRPNGLIPAGNWRMTLENAKNASGTAATNSNGGTYTVAAVVAFTITGLNPPVDTVITANQKFVVTFNEPATRVNFVSLQDVALVQANRYGTWVDLGGNSWEFTPTDPIPAGNWRLNLNLVTSISTDDNLDNHMMAKWIKL